MLKALTLAIACLAATPAVAAAEWHFTPMAGWSFRGSTTLIDVEEGTTKTHRQIGGSVALLGDGLFGAEVIGVFVPRFFQQDNQDVLETGRTYALMGNVVVAAPRRWTEYSLRPFVSGGLGLMRASAIDDLFPLPVNVNLTGINVGIGAIGFLSARTGIRFDLRYYRTLRRTDQGAVSIDPVDGRVDLRYFTGSIGLVLRR